MNETIALPHLAELMASIPSAENSDTEKFIRAFFSHLEDALAVSDSVTINGLGTFSRTTDPAAPLAFIPDQTITETLNRPFAMFVPVAVGDVDLSSVDGIGIIDTDPQDNTEESSPSEPESAAPSSTETSENEKPENIVSETVPEQSVPLEEPSMILGDNPCPDDTVPANEVSESEPRRHMAPWIIIAFMAGLLVGAFAMYFSYDKVHRLAEPSEVIDVTVEPRSADSAVTQAVPDSIASDTIVSHADTIKIIAAEIPDAESRHERYDTVTPNHFLTTMARKYYDKMEYWVFIYEANADRLAHPNRITPGTRVRIPEVSEFSNGETPEQILIRAKQKAGEIYDRF